MATLTPQLRAETVHITTPSSSLVLDATPGEKLRLVHFGSPAGTEDIANLKPGLDVYPAYGIFPEREAALSITHADGSMASDLNVKSVSSSAEADGCLLYTSPSPRDS